MNPESNARDAALRQALVDTVNSSTAANGTPRSTRSRLPFSWRSVSLIAAVAVASATTGAVSASVISNSEPYPANVTASLAASVARPNAVALGQAVYVQSDGTETVQLGEMPEGATNLAVRNSCTEAGNVTIELDGEWVGSFGCDAASSGPGSGGGTFTVNSEGPHILTFTSQRGSSYEAWIAWVQEPPVPSLGAQQKSDLADGTVTRDEYVGAFNRFAGCLAGAGFFTTAPDFDAAVLEYSIPAEAVTSGADELCYVSQFGEVDAAWQIQNEGSAP